MKSKRSNIKTNVKDIIEYWSNIEQDDCPSFDWSEADKVCWRCGYERKLQRCHIIPDSLGGKDEPSNFVLLCAECHSEAPNVENKIFMWDWIKSYNYPFYNTSLNIRAMEEYERIYKTSFYEELKKRNIVTDHALFTFWNLKVGKTSYHFGHPYVNVSTLAGKYKMHIDAFDAKYPSGKYLDDNSIMLEKDFEDLTYSICSISEKYNFSVLEGSSKNPYSLSITSHYTNKLEHIGISIRMLKNGNYKMCYTTEYNANYISKKLYNIELPNNHKDILEKVEFELKRLNDVFGPHKDNSLYFIVENLYWKRRNEALS